MVIWWWNIFLALPCRLHDYNSLITTNCTEQIRTFSKDEVLVCGSLLWGDTSLKSVITKKIVDKCSMVVIAKLIVFCKADFVTSVSVFVRFLHICQLIPRQNVNVEVFEGHNMSVKKLLYIEMRDENFIIYKPFASICSKTNVLFVPFRHEGS